SVATFSAQVSGTSNTYPVEWSGTLGSASLFPDPTTGTLVFPQKPVVVNPGSITIKACVEIPQGDLNTFYVVCASFVINVVPPVNFTVTPATVNSGETNPITITCTGCGATPTVTGGGNAPVQVTSITVAGDITTINATVSDRLVLNPDIIAIT